MARLLSVDGVCKRFDGKPVVDGVSFRVDDGETVALFGPNGCGKTTLLNIVSGITVAEGGSCTLRGGARTSYVFQNYRESLLPRKTGYANLALPLEFQSFEAEEARERVEEILGFFPLDFDLEKFPYQLSGGQQQMLAFVRALVSKPRLLLVDEALSALDFGNNLRLRTSLQAYRARFKPGILLVTHDLDEAVHLADSIVVLSKRPGRVVEVVENHKERGCLGFLTSPEFLESKRSVLSAFLRGEAE